MVQGTMEVLLVSAKGLENTDFLRNMDPYAILIYRTQEQKSSVASGKGSDPEWNESFVFTISDNVTELYIKLMDSDIGGGDDFVGEAKIPLEPLFAEGSLPPTVYNVVKDQEYRGEIKVGLTLTPQVPTISYQKVKLFLEKVYKNLESTKIARLAGKENDQGGFAEENFGGWRASN